MPLKMLFFVPKTAKKKVLPVLGFFFFRKFYIFVTARFSGGFWATNSVFCNGCVSLVMGERFCMDLCIGYRGFFFSPFSGCVFWFFLSLPLVLLLLLFWGPARVHFPSLLSLNLQDAGLPVPVQAGAAHTCCLSFLLSSLCPGRSPFPLSSSAFCILSLLCSFSLSLSFSCKRQQGEQCEGDRILQWPLFNTELVISMCPQPVMITSLPFGHSAHPCRCYPSV